MNTTPFHTLAVEIVRIHEVHTADEQYAIVMELARCLITALQDDIL